MRTGPFFATGLALLMLTLFFAGCDTASGTDMDWTSKYDIGDTGPGGGKIFYISDEGFTSTYDGSVCHYLEVAPSDMGPYTWITPGPDLTTQNEISGDICVAMGMDQEGAIGTGRKNTQLILKGDPAAPAALACADLSAGGKSDWFLPSKMELEELFKWKSFPGITIDLSYWSSSMESFTQVYYSNFSGFSGNHSKDDVDGQHHVRAVRAF